MWFERKGDARLGRCDSENCGGQPTWRLEADGVGSNYCSGCKSKIEGHQPTLAEALQQEAEALRRRFVHHTRPRHPLSMDEAISLSKAMDHPQS